MRFIDFIVGCLSLYPIFKCPFFTPKGFFPNHGTLLLMATRNPARKPPGMVLEPVVNSRINYQPQLVPAGFLVATNSISKNRVILGAKLILVGGFNPFEKYARQIGSFPQIGMKINVFELPPPTESMNFCQVAFCMRK